MKRLHRITGFLVVFLVFTGFHTHETGGDIQIEKEVVIAPKTGRASANIGSVNSSSNISMVQADVVIQVGRLPTYDEDNLSMKVSASFKMKNESQEALSLTVGFPVSNSSYSSFVLDGFHVRSNGELRSVFNRITEYPRRLEHRYISGPDPQEYFRLPDYLDPHGAPSDAPEMFQRLLFGIQKIGTENYQNLMVWKETFDPNQINNIAVNYILAVPLQKNRIIRRKDEGNYKGIWPQEANNMPLDFLSTLPEGEMFYFFDYYLTSGSSWKGVVGEQKIVLTLLGCEWLGHTLYWHGGPEILEIQDGDRRKTYSFLLKNAEPTANLYFALKQP